MTHLKAATVDAGKVSFMSSDKQLNEGFVWAKNQALEYAHFGEDAVGLWYEAALPSREAFCIRDVMHHSIGAAVLGLGLHTKNMMMRFAENIAESRDWCTYWEITKDNVPAPVDYDNDADFWYNLPANFDMIDASWRQYLWTGDAYYIQDETLLRFIELTLNEYTAAWDKDGDGLLEHYPEYGRRGLASYNEAGHQPLVGGDMVAAQIAGYRAYARIAAKRGGAETARRFEAKARELVRLYETEWWNEEHSRFYGALLQDRSFLKTYNAEGNFLPLYYGVIEHAEKRKLALKDLAANGVANVEGMTYLPDIYYRYGMNREALRELKALVDPTLERREYPEVSYCVVGSIAAGLMGIAADGEAAIGTQPRLAPELEWAALEHVPVLDRVIAVRHRGNGETELTLQAGKPLSWKAAFPAEAFELYHNGQAAAAAYETNDSGERIAYVRIEVAEGETHRVSVRP